MWLLLHILNGFQNLHEQWLETKKERRGQKLKLLSVQEHLESVSTGKGRETVMSTVNLSPPAEALGTKEKSGELDSRDVQTS